MLAFMVKCFDFGSNRAGRPWRHACCSVAGLETDSLIMKTSKSLNRVAIACLSILIAGATMVAFSRPGPHGHGTDILHFSIREGMFNDGGVAGAVGVVEASQNQQGHANNQRLSLFLSGLDTNTPYDLFALRDGDTNLSPVMEFTTDGRGRAALQLRDLGNGHGGGHGKIPLPDLLNPISQIRELDIFDASTQAVLTADFTMPNRLQYLIKRELGTDSVEASLRIKATTRQTQFRLWVDGLGPSADYWLVLNGDIAQSDTSDANGRLRIDSLPAGVTNILDLHSLELWDSSSNVVISTTLP
jgi:hypothetical protein